MRLRRLSLVAGWAVIALLAAVGFAAFRDPVPSAEQAEADVATASMGHTAGAYAGLVFTRLGGDEPASLFPTAPDPPPGLDPFALRDDVAAGEEGTQATDSAGGTIASPISGWLSQVEVRALVSVYFEPTDVNRAIRVAWCESRFDPNSVDLRSGGVGLFHHLPRYWDERAANAGFAGADPTDPEASVAAAAWEVYHGGGWDVFGCRG